MSKFKQAVAFSIVISATADIGTIVFLGSIGLGASLSPFATPPKFPALEILQVVLSSEMTEISVRTVDRELRFELGKSHFISVQSYHRM